MTFESLSDKNTPEQQLLLPIKEVSLTKRNCGDLIGLQLGCIVAQSRLCSLFDRVKIPWIQMQSF